MKRVFFSEKISQGILLVEDAQKVHHLLNVMRLKEGHFLRVFNETDGEWKTVIRRVIKQGRQSSLEIEVDSRIKKPEVPCGIKIAFSLIKPDRLNFLIEKATEIGVDGFIPVLTERSVIRNINITKIEAWIAGAVEQSERITVPKIMPLCSLKELIELYSQEQIIFCNEVESVRPISSISNSSSKIILIGPEGGFTNQERTLLGNQSNVCSVFLTKNILRSETAAIFALSRLFMSSTSERF